MIDAGTLCDRDAEMALLGSAMLDNAIADECLAVVPDEALYSEAHRRIWGAVRILRGTRQGCDVLTVAGALQAARDWAPVEATGGATYLADLVSSVPVLAHAPLYAAAVIEGYMRRSARDAGARFMSSLADPGSSPEDLVRLLDAVRRVMADAAAARRPVERLDELVVSAMRRVEDLYAGRESVGVPTGLGVLDAWCGGGLHPGDLTILGGRPSVGKSSLAQSIASHVARGGGRVYFASAEMGAEAVAIRALAAESGIDGRKFRGHPRMEDRDWPAVGQAVGRIGRYGPNLLVDTRSRTMPAIAAQARRLHAQEPLTLIVVDHLQHLQTVGREENRTRAVGAMAAQAKELAATLGVCVLVLSQLSRESPNAERKPRLSDLRDSGEIEQLADVVLLLHPDGTGDGRTKVRCLVAKHRNGELGEMGLVHERSTGRWFDQTVASRAPEPSEPPETKPQQVAMRGA